MKYLNHIRTPKSIVFMIENDKPITINSTDDKFVSVCNLLDDHKGQSAVELVVRELSAMVKKFSKTKNNGLNIVDGVVYYDDLKVPHALSERLLQLIDLKIDTKPLKEFISNLMKNPSAASRDSLYTFLEKNHVPLTDDGHFITYKGVTDDFKDKYSNTFNNSVGKTVSMERSKVNADPNEACSRGLHVAAWEYARHDYNCDTVVEVKVNPRDVVAVPNDYNSQKMRVCRYQVIGVAKAPYSSSVVKTKKVVVKTKNKAKTKIIRKKTIEVATRGGTSGIIRIPSNLKIVYCNLKNQIAIPLEILNIFGIEAKSKVWTVIDGKMLKITTDSRAARNSGHTSYMSALVVGNEKLLIPAQLVRTTFGEDKVPRIYEAMAVKGILTIKK